MIERKLAIPAIMALIMLSGCAGVDLVQAGKPADLGDGVSVTPSTGWAKIHGSFAGSNSILTIDGIGLDEVRYYMGVKAGQPIYEIAGVPKSQLGVYDAKMLPNDVMELLVANLVKEGAQDVHASALRPAKFGNVDGFLFDLVFNTGEGLNMRGEALAGQRDGKLDLLLYTAPDEFYFAHRRPDVEQLFSTVHVAN